MARLVLLRILESFFRHRWLYCLPPLLMVGVAAAYILFKPPVYNVSGRLFVEKETLLASLTASDQNAAMWRTPAQVTVSEMNELIATQAFVRSVIQRSDLEAKMSGGAEAINEAFTEFRTSTTVRELGDKLVEIEVENKNGRLAQQLVVATMDAYVQWKINNDYQESVAAQQFFANLLKPYEQEQQQARDVLKSYLESNPEPVRGERPLEEKTEIEQLQAAVTRADEKVNTTQKNEEDARLAVAKAESVVRQTYVVIDTPEVPQSVRLSLKDALKTSAIFVVVGLFLSIVGVALGAAVDRSFRFTTDVAYMLNLPVLAMVPVMRPENNTAATIEQPQSDAGRKPTAAPPQVYAAHHNE